MKLLTLREICKIIDEICKTDGCVCFECMNCGDKCLFFEGDIKHLYDKKYIKGCSLCSGQYKVYGYSGPTGYL